MQSPPSYDNVVYTPYPFGEPSPPYNPHHVQQPTTQPPASSGQEYPPPPYTYSSEHYPDQQSAASSYYPPSSSSASVTYSASQQQQQQQSVVVVNDFNTAPVIAEREAPYQSYTRHIVLSMVVCLLCCNWLFGAIAFVLAIAAKCRKRRDRQAARRLGNASISISVIGFVGAIIVLASVFGHAGRWSPPTVCRTGPYYASSDGYYYSCRRYVSSNASCHLSFSSCCNSNELTYSSGYCYSYRLATTTTPSPVCGGAPHPVNGMFYRCKRYAKFDAGCYNSYQTCCRSTESVYRNGYCYSQPSAAMITPYYCPFETDGICYGYRRRCITYKSNYHQDGEYIDHTDGPGDDCPDGEYIDYTFYGDCYCYYNV